MVYGSGVKIMSDSTLCNRLKELTIIDFERDSAETESKHSSLHSLLTQFMEQEARSCSMDFGCVTPIYIYRMFGGTIPLREIEEAFPIVVQKQMMVGRDTRERAKAIDNAVTD